MSSNQSPKEQTSETIPASVIGSVRTGALAGLAGGAAFGVLMAMMGMLPLVGMLTGQNNALVGLVVHLVISATFGAIYGIAAQRWSAGWLATSIAGVMYGSFWWVVGGLILMPLLLGVNQMILVVGATQWLSLIGHLFYGVITAIAFWQLNKDQ